MFHDLIPLLAKLYCLIAPNLSGYGQTKVPTHGTFHYALDWLAQVNRKVHRGAFA